MPRKSLTASRRVWAPYAALALFVSGVSAAAPDYSIKLEPGVAVPLSAPQAQIYGAGFGGSVKALFDITDFLDVGPSASLVAVSGSGTAVALGGGVRLKRPHDASSLFGLSPWLDADLLYVRTGPLNRAGFDVAVGVSMPLDESRRFWAGPFLRYFQITQPHREGYDNRDAKILTVGISGEFGSGISPRREPLSAAPAAAPLDGDHDGVLDGVDRCPEIAGSPENFGCPVYRKLVVKQDKLELKEKLFFAWDGSKIEEASFPVLDDVVQALKDNPGFRVQVEGHADSRGAEEHNQTLSEKRAAAVLSYLAEHGISRARLVSKGFSSSVPIDTNATLEGRENNRRVEFVVHFALINDAGAK